MFILSTIRENREQRRKGREVLRDLVTPAGIGRYSAARGNDGPPAGPGGRGAGKERGPTGTRDAESDKHFRQVARASGEAVEGRAEVAL